MAAIKSYTDLEQSKKLAEFLPLESADMGYLWNGTSFCEYPVSNQTVFKRVENIPCWSLSALLYILDYPQLSKDKLGSGKEGWMVSVYPNDCRFDSCWHDNPIDACYEMILKLHELDLL